MQERYLITGAAGHLGSTLCQLLAEEGKEIRALCLPKEKHLPQGPGIQIFYGNICDLDSLTPFFAGCEEQRVIVIHCAGIVSIASRFEQKVYDVNTMGTKNIIALCQKYHVDKLIYVSSVHAIPEQPLGKITTEIRQFDPAKVRGLYAKTKAEATQAVLAAVDQGLNASVVLPTGIAGPGDYGRGHLTQLVIDYVRGSLTSAMAGGYDFVDVRDVAAGILSCCEYGKKGDCYILGNRYYSVAEILQLLHKITGKREIRHFLPLWFIRFTAPLAEAYYKLLRQPPLFTSYSIDVLNSNALFSHEKADRVLHYSTRPMLETLTDTVAFLRETNRI